MKTKRKNILCSLVLTSLAFSGLVGCSSKQSIDTSSSSDGTDTPTYEGICSLEIPSNQTRDLSSNYVDDNYKNYYQILVQSYYDSNGDGIGDLKGLISKLDYLNSGDLKDENTLGVDGIYLLPIFKSGTYHKYDVDNYKLIDPNYGTNEDFDKLVEECNKRGISIILDLPLNHSSDDNDWFVQSVNAVKNATIADINDDDGTLKDEFIQKYPYAGFYNWKLTSKLSSAEKSRYRAYGLSNGLVYEAYFDSGMPDLNLDNSDVLDEIKSILKFWLDKGIKGFRLDGVEHYFDSSIDKTYEFCNKLYEYCKEIKGDDSTYLVGEGPWSSAVRNYYVNTNIPSYMNFYYGNDPTSTSKGQLNGLFKNESAYYRTIGLATEDSPIYLDKSGNICKDEELTKVKVKSNSSYLESIVESWDKTYDVSVNPNADKVIDANFLTNHDTVREINFMSGYKLYGDEEVMSETNLQRLKMIWGINHTLRGCSFTYYGEEIGMTAGTQYKQDSSDVWRNDPNKRHPMYWTSDPNANGMVKLSKIYGATKVDQILAPCDEQIQDKNSLWNFFKDIYKVKTYYPEIARGSQEIIYTDNNVVVMKKSYLDSACYLVYNLSRNEASISLEQLSLGDKEIQYCLSTDQTYSVIGSNSQLNLPDYSVTILK